MSLDCLQVGADRFPVAIEGTGSPVLFVHGAPGDRLTFLPHARMLSDRYRCITFTQRWFGPEPWREDGPPFGTGAHAADIVAVAAALEAGPVALVAWSYGAHAAMKAALDRPDLFRALLVYEPGFATFVSDPEALALFSEDAGRAWGPVFGARGAHDPRALIRAMWDASGGEGAFDRLPEGEQAAMLDSAAAIPRLLDQTPPVPISCADLGSLQVPAAVAWGGRSRPCFTIPSAAAAACIGGPALRIAEAGHLWPVTCREGFSALVREWLDGLDGSEAAAALSPAG